jgi:hypothetical protein
MALNELGRRYADTLYQKKLEEILPAQNEQLRQVTVDFAKRNMTQSGNHVSAKAHIIGKHLGLMAQARSETLLQAYERAGIPFDDAAEQEIATEVTHFCEAQKQMLTGSMQNMVTQVFQNTAPPGLASAVTGQAQRELMSAASRIVRDLAIKRYEIRLDEEKSRKIYASSLGKHWDVFVSHASEDKDGFVRPLADALAKSGLEVWYDEMTLKVGDRLREAIDRGLAQSQYGIVVLSRNFFAKDWPREELEGLSAKEISGVKVILPVWHEISKEEVIAFSPSLAGRLAAKSSDGMEKVVRDLRAAMGL